MVLLVFLLCAGVPGLLVFGWLFIVAKPSPGPRFVPVKVKGFQIYG